MSERLSPIDKTPPVPRKVEDLPGEPAASPAPEPTRYVLVIFHRSDAGEHFNYASVQEIINQIDAEISQPKDKVEIDVWVDSFGGDAHTVYKLALCLRAKSTVLRAIVPDYAKSAATLLVLAADEIHMRPWAELGPLDAQIPHPDKEDVWISALDVSRSLGYLGTVAVNMVLTGGGLIREITGLPRLETYTNMLNFSAAFLRPVVEKLDPAIIHQAAQQIEVTKQYGHRLLPMRNLRKKASRKQCEYILDRLVGRYPSHRFVVSPQEAKNLGLPVLSWEEYDQSEVASSFWQKSQGAALGVTTVLTPDKLSELSKKEGKE